MQIDGANEVKSSSVGRMLILDGMRYNDQDNVLPMIGMWYTSWSTDDIKVNAMYVWS